MLFAVMEDLDQMTARHQEAHMRAARREREMARAHARTWQEARDLELMYARSRQYADEMESRQGDHVRVHNAMIREHRLRSVLGHNDPPIDMARLYAEMREYRARAFMQALVNEDHGLLAAHSREAELQRWEARQRTINHALYRLRRRNSRAEG